MRALLTLLALAAVAVSVWVLESARTRLTVERLTLGETPVISYGQPEAEGPVVVIAHGFAGSAQMMQGYALPLARAGYRVFVFDFLGHGRHPVPMSGDVAAEDGTTRLLVDQTAAVIDAVADGTAPVALIGHSMATDVLVRVAAERGDIGPVVLLSAFSRVIDAETPARMLLVTGAWEPGLRDFAVEAARMVAPGAEAGETVTAGAVTRRAVIAPGIEHVSILHSREGRAEAIAWLDATYGRSSEVHIGPTGPAIVGLLAGLVGLALSLVRLLPQRTVPERALGPGRLGLILALPALAAPPLAILLDPGLLPVLVADHLALHLALYGGLQLGLLALWRVPFGRLSPGALAFLLVAFAVLCLALDRYAANFWPTPGRLAIIAALAGGALLFFVADARLVQGRSFFGRALIRLAFLASLGLAVALDFEGLFFLMMIAPVVVLFYIVFGTLGLAVARRAGPLAPGIALGLVLAYALGVSFPLFAG